MNFQNIERTVIITVGSRLTLVGIAIANWEKANWSFSRWSESATWQSNLMAGCIESALVIFTYMLAQRLIANAKKLKSDPEQPTKVLWAFVILLSLLSAFCNSLYFAHFGRLADPLDNLGWSTVTGIILGIAAPILAGGIAYLQGEEVATGIAVREAEEKREDQNRRRREKAAEKREAERMKAEAEVEEEEKSYSEWKTKKERLDQILRFCSDRDPEHRGLTRGEIFEAVWGNRERGSIAYQDIDNLIKAKQLSGDNRTVVLYRDPAAF